MTPKDYQRIAKKAYQVQKNNKEGYALREGSSISINGTNWQVLKVKDNPWTGFQAMAVAPVSDGNNPSNVVIAYAGTNLFQFGDLYSDVANVINLIPFDVFRFLHNTLF